LGEQRRACCGEEGAACGHLQRSSISRRLVGPRFQAWGYQTSMVPRPVVR
jgi:hypothetical protein